MSDCVAAEDSSVNNVLSVSESVGDSVILSGTVLMVRRCVAHGWNSLLG